MKKIICLLLGVMLTALTFAGCGKTAERQLYNEKLSKYINLGEYKGIKVDTKSDEFKKFYLFANIPIICFPFLSIPTGY